MYQSRLTLFVCLIAIGIVSFSQHLLAKEKFAPELKDNLVILQYHHVATNTPTITSTPPDVFAEHLAYLHQHFNVVALPEAIDALRDGTGLPDKSVAITFDGLRHRPARADMLRQPRQCPAHPHQDARCSSW